MKVQALDIESFPRGSKSQIYLELIEDPFGEPLCLPILIARGERPGPVVGITSAVHGDELNGIPVMHRFFSRLDPKQLKGTVVGVVAVNVQGLFRQQRRFINGVDLNHIMPGVADGNASAVYAHRFMDRVVRHFEALIDLHTASFGRVNCLYVRADMTDARTARMTHLLRPQIIVHNPPSDGTLRGAAGALGIPAITVEIGDPSRFQEKYIKPTIGGIRAILAREFRMLPRRKGSRKTPNPIVCGSSRWLYTDAGGFLEVFPQVVDIVEEGEVIGRQTRVFGDVHREYRSPARGVVVGKSINPVGQTGARILHLGDLEPESSTRFSHPTLDESTS